MKNLLHKIIEGWYIYDNALFEISLTHSLKENNRMSCPLRCGKGVIEFNSTLLSRYPKGAIEELLKIECVRIILKHPYERQPVDCSPIAKSIASDIIIADNYHLKAVSLNGAQDYGLEKDNCFEWYAHHIEENLNQNTDIIGFGVIGPKSDSSTAIFNAYDILAEKSELWEEDTFMETYLNTIIEKIDGSKNWGSIPGNIVETIVASARGKIDYRKVLSGFRASIMSSKRLLTRMRPNRRTGFENMGSIRRLNTRLLVAIDVSSSVSSVSLYLFLSVVNKAFKYGIEELDLITFDTEIHDRMQFKKAKNNIEITGRGGTDFQCAIDYAVSEKYDGVILFTDGEAPVPTVPPFKGLKVAWVIDTPHNYRACQESLSKVGRCCVIDN